MNKGGSQQVGDFELAMTHAMHSNSIDDDGVRLYGGEPAGFVVTSSRRLHGISCGRYRAFRRYETDRASFISRKLAMLPIGDLFTMGPREAAQAIRFLRVKHVIPMHYATFPMLTGTPDALRRETADIADLTIYALQPGESL